MSFKELTDYCQAQAILNKLTPDEEGVWRYLCRLYSKRFSTPLHEVLNMAPDHVILNVYEDQLDELDTDENLEKILDMIYSLEDPLYEQEKGEEFERFLEQAEIEEQERIKKGKPIHPALAKENEVSLKAPPKEEPPAEPMPTGGSIDLSYLDREENGGFEY